MLIIISILLWPAVLSHPKSVQARTIPVTHIQQTYHSIAQLLVKHSSLATKLKQVLLGGKWVDFYQQLLLNDFLRIAWS